MARGEPPAGRPAGRPVVLVVDDDSLHRMLAATVLEDEGMATIQAGSGAEALRIMVVKSVDAVVVDQMMPGMTGIELARRIRALPAYSLLPIIFVSADDSSDLRIEALQAGASDFMVKPLVLDEMVARVQAHLRVATRWSSQIDVLRTRAATVSEIAGLAPSCSPAELASEICRRISAAHDGRAVSILSWPVRFADPVVIGSHGSPPSMKGGPGVGIGPGSSTGPWVRYPPAGGDTTAGWWACAPMLWGSSAVGLLAIEGGETTQEEMLSTVADYASTTASKLGPALTEDRRTEGLRLAVEDVLQTGAFHPVFQPVIELRTGRVIGYEALTRLSGGHSVLQLLADADDAHIRPECELVLIDAALREAARLPERAWVSLNISPSVLVEHAGDLGQLLQSAPAQVVLELTENERIDDYPAVREALVSLGNTVRLSVDDTGSGYASLRHVIDLRPHYLKLDRSWITGLEGDDTRQALVAGIVAFCDHSATELIAEGIERDAERAVLESLGVGYGQGFLLGAPAPLPPAEPA